jgi:hypothetical protein
VSMRRIYKSSANAEIVAELIPVRMFASHCRVVVDAVDVAHGTL